MVSLSAKKNNSKTKLQVLGYKWQGDFTLLGLDQVVDDGIIYVEGFIFHSFTHCAAPWVLTIFKNS